jgi:ABC-type multidrug transport system ATPase subunit
MKIELQQVLKKFKSVRALDEVSLAIEPGQVVALLGPNGAGKTTLLRCLAGIVAPDRGEIYFDGEAFRRNRLDLRRRFLFLPDFPAVFEEWSPLQHLGMVLRLFGVDGSGLEDRVTEVLAELDLLPLAGAPLVTLSRGQRYKAALAALVVADPEVWLLDEPFASGMDSHGINAFKRRARDASHRGRTVLYSTQILDAAERFSDRVCVIHQGKIRAFSATADLRRETELKAPEDGTALDALFNQLREEDIS